MKKIFILCCALMLMFRSVYGQERKLPLTLSLFNNGSALPGTGLLGVFSRTIHPGITIGTYHMYHTGNKHEFFQTLKLGYFYHRFVQHGIQLYSEAGYRYLTRSGIYGEVLLGAGYMHSIPDVQRFEFKDGEYVKKTNLGRPQFMISSGLGLGYDLEKKGTLPLRLFILYQFWLQAPFVNKYVPLLPNTALHLGVRYLLHRRIKNPDEA